MGAIVPATPSEPSVPVAATQPSSADPATAGQIAQGTQSSPGYTTLTKVSSLGALRKQAPEVYKMMMESIAMSMIQQNQREQDRLKEAWRKAREDSGET